jgi:hypothetical protein
MPRRANYTPLYPDPKPTRLRAIRGTRRKYFVSARGNIYHMRDVFGINGVSLLKRKAVPLAPDFGGRRGRARVELFCPHRRRGKRWHPDVLWLVARAWGYREWASGAPSPLKMGPMEYSPLNHNRFDFRVENIAVRTTGERLLQLKWRTAQSHFNKLADSRGKW